LPGIPGTVGTRNPKRIAPYYNIHYVMLADVTAISSN